LTFSCIYGAASELFGILIVGLQKTVAAASATRLLQQGVTFVATPLDRRRSPTSKANILIAIAVRI
jgi:hypothetical protein